MMSVADCAAIVARLDSTIVVDEVWFNDARAVVFWSSSEGPIEGNGPIVVDRRTGRVSFTPSFKDPDQVIAGMSRSSDLGASQEPQNGPPGPGQP